MAVTLNPCVRAIVCALSQPLRNALQAQLQIARTNISAQIFTYRSKVAQYDVLAAGAQIVVTGAAALRNQLEAATRLIPLTAISGCVDMGDLNLSIQQDIDRAGQKLTDELQGLTRLLSIQDELQDLIDVATANLGIIDAVLTTIGQC